MTLTNDQIKKRINELVQQGLERLPSERRNQIKPRLIEPRPIVLSLDMQGKTSAEFWLVTDNFPGAEPASYRITYRADQDKFGLEVTLKDGIEWYSGNYGSFEKTVMMM